MSAASGQGNSGGAAAAAELARAHRRIGLRLAGVVAGMTALAFASVPLYRLFCQTTGYNGTTQRASAPSTEVLARQVTMRFDANAAKELGWSFEPVNRTDEIHVGETKLAFYRATNTSDKAITGTAVFNVVPEGAGIHFNKIECFCFKEQTLMPGESVDMPVSYFIDAGFDRDPDLKGVSVVTLSYTFYPAAPAGGRPAEKTASKGS